MRKVFSPLVWLFIVTLPFGMFFTFNLVWPEMGLTTDDPGSLALIQFLSFIFSGGYILGAAGIGLFTRGSARARLSFGLGASVILWVLLAFPDLESNPSRTILTGEGGTTPSRFKHIISTKAGGYRRLTPIELERLNGFPDDWTKVDVNGDQVADGKRAFFMGNALVVGLIEMVGKEIAKNLNQK